MASDPPPPPDLPAALRGALEPSPFRLAGVLDAGGYDARVPPAWRTAALLPSARSAVLLASAGPGFLAACREALPDFDATPDPLDRFARASAEALAAALDPGPSRCLLYADRVGGEYADFVALGLACGLGAMSRLGLVLHPRYGPWLAIRALVLTQRALKPSMPMDDFAPCRGCAAPCAAACPGEAVGPRFDARACSETRLRHPGCAQRCDARRACVVGREWQYGVAEETLYASVSLGFVRRAAKRENS